MDINHNLEEMAQNVVDKIKTLENNIEFRFVQFFDDDLTDKERFSLCEKIVSLLQENGIIYEEKMPNADIGLPWAIPFIKKEFPTKKNIDYINNDILLCPICNSRLSYMMPAGTTLCCTNCNKYFINESGKIGKETTYPYVDKNADY